MEFENSFKAVCIASQDAERFEDDDHAGTIIVCAGAARGGIAAREIKMGVYDDQICRKAGDAGDDVGLVVRMGELGNCDGGVGGSDGFREVEKAGCGLGAVGGTVIRLK